MWLASLSRAEEEGQGCSSMTWPGQRPARWRRGQRLQIGTQSSALYGALAPTATSIAQHGKRKPGHVNKHATPRQGIDGGRKGDREKPAQRLTRMGKRPNSGIRIPSVVYSRHQRHAAQRARHKQGPRHPNVHEGLIGSQGIWAVPGHGGVGRDDGRREE